MSTPLVETLDRRIVLRPRQSPREGVAGTVYIIHFSELFHHAQHYIGWAKGDDIEDRMDRHWKGNGAALMRAVSAEGIPWEIARVWHNADRHFERWLKEMKRTADFCPLCSDPPRKVRADGTH